jgi:hypothetical protein
MSADEHARFTDDRSAFVRDLLALRRLTAGHPTADHAHRFPAVGQRISDAVTRRTDEELAALRVPRWMWEWDETASLAGAILKRAEDDTLPQSTEDDALVLAYALERASGQDATGSPPPSTPDASSTIAVITAADPHRALRLTLLVRETPGQEDSQGSTVETATREVRGLLRELETPLNHRISVEDDGLADTDPTLALPIALRILRENVPPLGAEPVIATGEPGDQGFRPLSSTEVQSRLEALEQEGPPRQLLVPTAEGWAVVGSDGTTAEHRDPDRTLAGAAQAVWGQRWREWALQRRTKILQRLGWDVLDGPPTSDPPVPLTEVSQVDQLETIFRRRRNSAAVLGGTTNSGKSSIGWLLAERLRGDWQTVTIAARNGRLPSSGELRRVVGAAVGTLEQHNGPRLVILDNIEPTTEFDEADIDELLPQACSSANTAILALLRYDMNATDWKTETLPVVCSVVSQEAALRFAEELVQRNAELFRSELSGAGTSLADIVRRHHGDASRIAHALKNAASLTADTAAEPLRDRDLASLGAEELEALARLAAVSLLGNEVRNPDNLYPLTREELPQFAAQRSPSGGWRLPNHDDCRRVIRRVSGPSQTLSSAIAEHAAPELQHLLAQYDAPEQATSFLRRASLANESACRQLMRRTNIGYAFDSWVRHQEPTVAAELVLAADSVFSPGQLRALDAALFDDVRMERLRYLSAGRLLLVLRAVYRFRHRCSSDAFDTCAGHIANAVEDAIDGDHDNVTDLYRIIELLSRFHHDGFNRLIATRGASALRGLDPAVTHDYLTAQRTAVLVRRTARSAGIAGEDLAEQPTVKDLLANTPDPKSGLPLFVAWLALRLELDHLEHDWSVVWQRHGGDMRAAVRHSDISELRLVLNELHRQHPAFCIRLLNELNTSRNLSRQLRTLVEKHALPAESAMLIGTLANRHARLAYEVLYDDHQAHSSGRADSRLARTLAESIHGTGDNKGAGMLLGSTYIVDDWSGRPAEGFANLLATHLGKDWFIEQVDNDPRMSVIGHLVRKMWQSRPDFRETILDHVRARISHEISRALRPWGPQLALTIAEDHSVGTEFLSQLRDDLDEDRLLEGMGEAGTSTGRTFFHRLGRTLYRELPSKFLHSFDHGSFDRPVLDSSPTTAVECLTEMSTTLRAAGTHAPNQAVVRTLPGDVRDRLFANLGKRSSAAEIAAVLRMLHRLDRDLAQRVVAQLTDPRQRGKSRSTGGSAYGTVGDRVRQAMFTGSPAAADLMVAVELVAPGRGAELLDEARDARSQWEVFTGHVRHFQDPTQQWIVAKHLHRTGLRFESTGTRWMNQVYESRRSYLHTLTGPRIVGDVLRMFSLWREEWAREAAQHVNIDRLATRFADGTQPDLKALPTLLETLERFGVGEGADRIADRVAEMGREITGAYPPDEPLLMLGLLKGSFIFLADLVRRIDRPLTLDFLVAASYGAGTVTSGDVRLLYDPDSRLEGQHVILVEDIVDSGTTLNRLVPMLEARAPRSLEV